MAEKVLQDVLEWCFKNTNILVAKDNDKYGESLIHFASEKGYVSVVTQLLAKGVYPDLKDNSEFASLHLASRNGHTEIAKVLIQNGADLNSQTNEKETPIYIASLNGHSEVVKILIQNGANVNSKNGAILDSSDTYDLTPPQ